MRTDTFLNGMAFCTASAHPIDEAGTQAHRPLAHGVGESRDPTAVSESRHGVRRFEEHMGTSRTHIYAHVHTHACTHVYAHVYTHVHPRVF